MKNIIIITISIFITINLFTQEINLNEIHCYEYNDYLKNFTDNSVLIKYDIETDTIYFITADIFDLSLILFDRNTREEFRALLKKYLEWNEKAIAKQVKIEKAIKDFTAPLFWKFGDEWHIAKFKSIKISGNFLSQNENNHQLVLIFQKAESAKNEFVTNQIDPIYFNFKDITLLLSTFEEIFISQTVDNFNKQKNLEDEFQ